MIYSQTIEQTYILGGNSASIFIQVFNLTNLQSTTVTANIPNRLSFFTYKPISISLAWQTNEAYVRDGLFYTSGLFYDSAPTEPNCTSFIFSYDVSTSLIKAGFRW